MTSALAGISRLEFTAEIDPLEAAYAHARVATVQRNG
jgi:hypothetical protein